MRLAYISFWSIEDGLTQASVIPVIRYLLDHKLADSIVLFTPEIHDSKAPDINGLKWHPIRSRQKDFMTSGFKLLLLMTWRVGKHIIKHKNDYDLIWARASTAGGSAALISWMTGILFGVESFEPHAEYMVESGVWKVGSLKYKVQRWLERLQTKNAIVLIAVAESFTQFIREKGVTTSLYTIPCTVDFEAFRFNLMHRDAIREKLGIPSKATTGIYVGKVGDIYYDHPFFNYLSMIFKGLNGFHLILLSPDTNRMQLRISEFDLPKERIHLLRVPHNEVASYLSAADLGFCPVKPAPSKRFCSPVKTGEYLANGLPVLIAEGIGDDSQFIHENRCGLIVNFTQNADIGAIKDLVTSSNRTEITASARPFRSTRIRFKTYHSFFTDPQIPK